MRWMLVLTTCLMTGMHSSADDTVTKLMSQFREADDETEKNELVFSLNRAVLDAPERRAEAAQLFRTALDTAESLELVSSLAWSWWRHEDKSRALDPETTQLVFGMLDDVRRHEHRRSSPVTPRERAIHILASCEESVLPRIVNLLENDLPMHRAAGISILTYRRYFDTHFGRLELFFDSKHPIVQLAVAQALRQNETHRDKAVAACFHMMNLIKEGSAYDQMALAVAAQSAHVGSDKAWAIQQGLLKQRNPKRYQSQLHRAISYTVSALSDEHQKATVKEIAFDLQSHWLETAVIVAGPNGMIARDHFVKRLKEAKEKDRIRRAYYLYRIERDADRVLPIFMQGLENKSSTQRYYAFAGIRAMGPEAKEVAPMLTAMLESDNKVIVRQSLQALTAIKPDSPKLLETARSIAAVHQDQRVVKAAGELIAVLTDKTQVD